MKRLLVSAVLLTASVAAAQGKPTSPPPPTTTISQSLRGGYDRVKKYLTGTAEKMPADAYDFKPTPDVRAFGQIVGHVVDAQYNFCALAKGEKNPMKASAEKTMTGKDALKKALADAFAYCDPVYAGLTDAELLKPIELFGAKRLVFTAVDFNVVHDFEHYGNLVTYMRLKKIVPPSSEPQH